ncbi:MAG TPA: YdcH family protein [Vicinamibacterales bacterium]|nr:YdcH family protein [Vicinamibacterales bacterium]
MPTDFEAIRQQLLESNDEFRQLASQHHDLDERIHNLATRPYLSEPEQLEEVTLKKRKLHLKDQMESILRHSQAEHGLSSARH